MELSYESARELSQLAGVMLSEPDLPSALRRVTAVTSSLVDSCDGTSLTMRSDGIPAAAAADNDWSRELDELQYREQEGPCLDCLREGTVMRVRDMRIDQRFPTYGERAAALGVRSSLSVPLAADGRTVGALNLYSRQVDAFDSVALAMAELLAAHAALAIQAAAAFYSSRDLAEQMREAVVSRAVIEQAKGVLISQRQCSADDAFALLVAASQRTNRKLRDVARSVVDDAVGGTGNNALE